MDDILNYQHPFVCTDAVVFTIKTLLPDSYRKLSNVQLKVLLYCRKTEPFKNKWCLPGGFLNIDEMPKDNVRRKLLEKSGTFDCYLEQMRIFADLKRDPRARVISLSYLGLMCEAQSKKFDCTAVWLTVQQKDSQIYFTNDDVLIDNNEFAFDHFSIITAAINKLKTEVWHGDTVFHLLPPKFTLTELQNVFEVILNKKDSPANFRRKIIDRVDETGEYSAEKGHRPAKLYTRRG